MWKYYFNCNGPVIIEAGNINEARQLCTQEYGCDPCEYLGCDPSGLCDASTSWKPDDNFLLKANARKATKKD